MAKLKKSFTKTLAIILSALMLICVLPMQTFATEYRNYQTLTTIDIEPEPDLIIQNEVIEERTANSKTYLLEDGTYCDLIFSNPIHKKDNGEWEDQSNTESYITEGESISRVASQLSSTTTDDGLVMLDPKVSLSLIGITKIPNENEENEGECVIDPENTTPDYTITEDYATLTDNSLGVVSFDINSSKKYEKAEATINVNLIMDYYSNEVTNNIGIHPFNLDLSDKSLKFCQIHNQRNNPTIDFNKVIGEGQAIWNITSEYIKIENGTSNNNDLLIGQDSGNEFTIYNAYMQRHYRVIDDNDIGFTYHTVDMGRAGMVYINDYTNTVNVEREELGLPGGILVYQYDDNKNIYSYIVNGKDLYVYEKNASDDIIGVYNNGECVGKYHYDEYGNVYTMYSTEAVSKYNQLYYRGYIYDAETELYYLQSRYYSPEWGRFLNADIYVDTGNGLLGTNMYIYCNNDPINNVDPTGYWGVALHKQITHELFYGETLEYGLDADKIADGNGYTDTKYSAVLYSYMGAFYLCCIY